MNEEQLLARMTVLESRQKRAFYVASLVLIVLISVLVLQWRQIRSAQHPQKLSVRELSVVDERGTKRVLITAPLPDPTSMGKQGKRDGKISGIIILDATGNERGGYAMDDSYGNAMLTLDGQRRQTALLLAEPDGSTMFRIWNKDSSITMGAFENPFLNMKQNGKPVLIAPPENPQSRDSRLIFR